MNSKYVYPAIFTKEKDGGYSITFPDVKGCFTEGNSLPEGIYMAEDALALCIYSFYEEKHIDPPTPSDVSSIRLKKNQFVNLIACDTLAYRKKFNSKAVKKTVTIPSWLNEEALALELNFSQLLKEALLSKVNM